MKYLYHILVAVLLAPVWSEAQISTTLRRDEMILPADYADSAEAAFSLVYISEPYIGDVVEVRRCSDDSIAGFTPDEVTSNAMLDWVNTQVIQYESDYTPGNEDLGEWHGIGTDGETIGGIDNAYKFELIGGSAIHEARKLSPIVSTNVRFLVTFNYYIPSTNASIDAIEVRAFTGDYKKQVNAVDVWTSDSLTVLGSTNNNIRFIAANGTNLTTDSNGDVFYLKNVKITQQKAHGYVTTWYDQRNGHNATQPVLAKQPRIVINGLLVAENDKPAIDFDGVNDELVSSQIDSFYNHSAFSVQTSVGGSGYIGFYTMSHTSVKNVRSLKYLANPGYEKIYYYNGNSDDIENPYITGTQFLAYTSNLQNNTAIYGYNGSLVYDTNGTTPGTGLAIGQSDGFLKGTVQEIILYTWDMLHFKATIEAQCNKHYNIY